MTIFDELRAPFPPEQVKWRVGATTKDKSKGMALAYVDARTVQDRLDDVLGPAGWQCRFHDMAGKTCCEIGVQTIKMERPDDHPDVWIWKSDGAGQSDVEGDKGAFSDAFKRAAVRWGVGRYLYDLPSPWLKLDQYKRFLPDELPKLEQVLSEPARAPSSPPDAVEPPDKTADKSGLSTAQFADKIIAGVMRVEDVKALQEGVEAMAAKLDKLKAESEADYDRVMVAVELQTGKLLNV